MEAFRDNSLYKVYAGRAQDMESSTAKDRRSTTVPHTVRRIHLPQSLVAA